MESTGGRAVADNRSYRCFARWKVSAGGGNRTKGRALTNTTCSRKTHVSRRLMPREDARRPSLPAASTKQAGGSAREAGIRGLAREQSRVWEGPRVGKGYITLESLSPYLDDVLLPAGVDGRGWSRSRTSGSASDQIMASADRALAASSVRPSSVAARAVPRSERARRG